MPTLELAIAQTSSPEPGFFDLELRLRFLAAGPPVFIYPTATRNACIAGWTGPSFRWILRCDERAIEAQQLRTWYGPPGHPPATDYFRSQRTRLEDSYQHVLRAALIHASALRPADLAVQTLDPKGLDRFAGAPDDLAAVLVLDEGCDKLLQRRREGPGFLRPGLVAFLPQAASTTLAIAYEQRRMTGFEPETPLVLESAAFALAL